MKTLRNLAAMPNAKKLFWFALMAVVAFAHPFGLAAMPLLGVGAIMDARAEFCDATALNTGAAGTYLIGNVMDASVARDLGNGRQIYLVISVDTAVTSAGAATVQFLLVSDAQAALATDGSATQHYASFAIPKATLVAGYQLVAALPPESPAYERYLGVLQVTGTAALTAGKVNAYLTLDPPVQKSYPDAI